MQGATQDPYSVSVVVPVYRNSDTLLELHRRLRYVLPTAEILFVDDACPDDSCAVLEAVTRLR